LRGLSWRSWTDPGEENGGPSEGTGIRLGPQSTAPFLQRGARGGSTSRRSLGGCGIKLCESARASFAARDCTLTCKNRTSAVRREALRMLENQEKIRRAAALQALQAPL
jgi:hypothetical protein